MQEDHLIGIYLEWNTDKYPCEIQKYSVASRLLLKLLIQEDSTSSSWGKSRESKFKLFN